jgi:GntR family transcriptional repressor for pyruvate dehydrogenase complex
MRESLAATARQALTDRIAPRRETAVGTLVRQLREMIAEQGLRTGDSLPTERELSERFGVARNTVREAIGALRAYGVIDVRPKVGAVLINRHIEAALDVFSFQLAISAETFRDIQGFRNLVEAGLFDLIAPRMTAADLDALDALTDAMRDAATIADCAGADLAFHVRLIGLAGNKTLLDVYRIMEPVILRLMENGKGGKGRDLAVESHRQIVAALRRGDRLAFQFYTTDHLQQGRLFIDSLPAGKS